MDGCWPNRLHQQLPYSAVTVTKIRIHHARLSTVLVSKASITCDKEHIQHPVRGAKGRFNQYEIGNLAGVNCIMLCTVLWSPDEVSYSLGSDAYPHRLRLSNIYPCPFRRLMVHWKISTVVTLMVLAIGHRQNRTHHLPKPQGGHNNTGITKRARQ